MYCESAFLLSCDSPFHIFHQQISFFHLFAHLCSIITKTFQLVLKSSKGTVLNSPSLHLSHYDSQELQLFPDHPSTHQYFCPLLYVYFATSACLSMFTSSPPERNWPSYSSGVHQSQRIPVPWMLPNGQTSSDFPHSIYPWAICPSLLPCHAFAFLFWGLERFHWVLCTWKYHCHLAGRTHLPCCRYCTILKWNHVYNEDYRLPTSKSSFLQWLLGQISGATLSVAFCNPIRHQVRSKKIKKDVDSNTTRGGKGRYPRTWCIFSVIIYR